MTVLLVARLAESNEDVKRNLDLRDLELVLATNLDEVRSAFKKKAIDHMIMGAGIELDARLEIVREVFRSSDSTTVHMKDRTSGRAGYLPFVQSTLSGLREFARARAV